MTNSRRSAALGLLGIACSAVIGGACGFAYPFGVIVLQTRLGITDPHRAGHETSSGIMEYGVGTPAYWAVWIVSLLLVLAIGGWTSWNARTRPLGIAALTMFLVCATMPTFVVLALDLGGGFRTN